MISEPYFWDRNRIIDFQTPQVLQFQPISTDHVSYMTYIETFYKTTTLKFDQHHLFLPSISTFASTLFFFFKYCHHFHVVNCDWLSIIFTCTHFFFSLDFAVLQLWQEVEKFFVVLDFFFHIQRTIEAYHEAHLYSNCSQLCHTFDATNQEW